MTSLSIFKWCSLEHTTHAFEADRSLLHIEYVCSHECVLDTYMDERKFSHYVIIYFLHAKNILWILNPLLCSVVFYSKVTEKKSHNFSYWKCYFYVNQPLYSIFTLPLQITYCMHFAHFWPLAWQFFWLGTKWLGLAVSSKEMWVIGLV